MAGQLAVINLICYETGKMMVIKIFHSIHYTTPSIFSVYAFFF